jgi:hypothetical protein
VQLNRYYQDRSAGANGGQSALQTSAVKMMQLHVRLQTSGSVCSFAKLVRTGFSNEWFCPLKFVQPDLLVQENQMTNLPLLRIMFPYAVLQSEPSRI